jgi:TolB-like protein/Tfp pilus assembly protein PilF
MKRCPECRRDYYDDSLAYCLDDGEVLLDGPPTFDEPATAIIPEAGDTKPATRTFGADASDTSTNRPARIPSRRNLIVVGIIALVLLAAAGFGGYRYYLANASRQISSIAVMPFVNETGDADVEYLSDGMAETLISSLSKVANLSVKSRSAVFAYKGKELSAREMGDDLGVQALLLGRLAERSGNIKLNLELVDAKTQDVIWSEHYDRKQADLVNLQSEIARDVSSKLRSKLSGEDQNALSKKYTDDSEAYRLYLQARFYLNKRVGKEYEKAEGFLRQSIEHDPNFALGYVGLAEFISQSDRPKAKEYIARALAIDNQLSEAHANLGLQLTSDHDWAAAERELDRAIELDPNNSRAHKWKGDLDLMIGRYDECQRSYDQAIALDPTSADLRSSRAVCFVAAGKIDGGMAAIKDAMRVEPDYAWSYSHISFVYRMQGDHAASVEARAHSQELLDRPDLAKRLRDTFASDGWQAYLRELLAQTTGNFNSPTRRASILAELGEKEEAMAELGEGKDKGDFWLVSIKYDPAFDQLRSDQRFQALVKLFEPPQ